MFPGYNGDMNITCAELTGVPLEDDARVTSASQYHFKLSKVWISIFHIYIE